MSVDVSNACLLMFVGVHIVGYGSYCPPPSLFNMGVGTREPCSEYKGFARVDISTLAGRAVLGGSSGRILPHVLHFSQFGLPIPPGTVHTVIHGVCWYPFMLHKLFPDLLVRVLNPSLLSYR